MSTQEPTILTEVVDGVATVTLNRPARLNAITPEMGRDYAAALVAADADPAVRVAIVTGAGRGFCAGADLEILAQGPDALAGFVAAQSPADLPTVPLGLGIPVVAAINGPAAGVGVVMALAADVRFAAPSATLHIVFPRLGLIAEYGIAWLLAQSVGQARAREILISGRSISAQEAYDIGLVHAIDDDPVAAAQAWATDVATQCSPTSVAVIKGQLLRASEQDLATNVAESLDLMRESFTRPDLAEALLSRLDKRDPAFPPRG